MPEIEINAPQDNLNGGGGGATTDAGDLTTGTLAAARLPGVLANVDTQAELLSAAAAAAASHTHAASDIASGTVGLARGGTNADLSATGGTGHVLKQSSAGANITVGALTASEISGLSGVINDAGITGGTSTAYTATLASRPNPLTSGYTFVCVFHTTNGSAATITLSSGTAQPLWTNGAAAPAGAIIAGTPYVCRSDGTRVHLIGTLGIQLKTKFGSYTTSRVVVDDNYVYVDSDTETLRIGDGNAPQIALYGDNTGSNKGCAFHYLGSATGAKHSLYDKNGAEQLRVDETGVLLGGNSSRGILQLNIGAAASGLYAATDALEFSIIMGNYLTYGGPQIYGYGASYSTSALQGYMCMYPGKAGAVLQLQSWSYGNNAYLEYGDAGTKNVGRKVSIPTGGAWTTLVAIDGTQALRFATVTAHGTILLEWDGTTLTKLAGAATLVVAGSAGGTEIAFRVSGGNLQASNGTGTSRNGSSGFSIQH